MFRVIALRGTANTGKTETLNLLIDMLACDSDMEIMQVNEKERWAIGEYNGLKVAVTTQGDSGEQLEEWTNYVDSICKNVDIYVCPCRIRGSSFDFIYNLFGSRNVIFNGKIYVIRYGENDDEVIKVLQKNANRIQAELLFEIIKDYSKEGK